jgi:hypothetical protein
MVHLEFNFTQADLKEMTRTRLPKPLRGSKYLRIIIGWVVIVLIGSSALNRLQPDQSAPPGPAAPTPASAHPWLDTLVALLPWLFICVAIWGLFFWVRRSLGTVAWKTNPRFRMPATIDIATDGIHVSFPVLSSHWRWTAFHSWTETQNMFVLFTTARERMGIPKRSMPNPAAINEVRQLLGANIQRHIGGFPVLPVQPL